MFVPVLIEEGNKFRIPERGANQQTLHQVAFEAAQELELFTGLNPLRNHLEVQGVGHGDSRAEDGSIMLTAAAPVQKVKQVLGVALLVRKGTEYQPVGSFS